MLFSVVIPSYNRSALLREALDSVFAQTFTDYEVIVVDDGSTDDTMQMLAAYGQRVRLFQQPNQGPGPARNLGVKHAIGDYLTFLDSDDLWFPWTLSVYHEVIETCGRPSFICKAMIQFTDKSRLLPVWREPLDFEKFDNYFESIPKRIFVGAGMAVIRNDVFLRAGCFASAPFYAEDVDLAMRLGCEPGFVRILSPATLAYRQNPKKFRSEGMRLYDGISYIIEQESQGKYPGGDSRMGSRRTLITMHSRPASLKILKIGLKPQARSLYLRTAVWNLQQERVRYLLSFLFLGVLPKYVQNVLEAKDDASTLDVPQGKPSFSVVIPTYNRSAWLREALESIFQQVFEDYEVIVVDDGSTDDTSQMLRQYGNRLVCLTQKNLGPGTARNLGVKHAKGRYIAFLDSDDLWFPWTLATYERIAREQDWPAFISGEHFLFTDTKELALVKKEPVEYATFSNYLASAKSWSWYGVSSFVIRRDEFERVEGFAKKWINAEDADFALRMSVSPGFITVHSPVTFGFRTHDGGQTQHLSKTLAGAEYLIQREVSEHYAGGRAKKRERIEIITRHVRPVALQLLNLRMHNEAWRLYWASLYWHLRLRRLKFLAGFLLKACFNR